jgi:hypothetical protein
MIIDDSLRDLLKRFGFGREMLHWPNNSFFKKGHITLSNKQVKRPETPSSGDQGNTA